MIDAASSAGNSTTTSTTSSSASTIVSSPPRSNRDEVRGVVHHLVVDACGNVRFISSIACLTSSASLQGVSSPAPGKWRPRPRGWVEIAEDPVLRTPSSMRATSRSLSELPRSPPLMMSSPNSPPSEEPRTRSRAAAGDAAAHRVAPTIPAATCTFLLADGCDDVAAVSCAGDLLRVEPDAHRVAPAAAKTSTWPSPMRASGRAP